MAKKKQRDERRRKLRIALYIRVSTQRQASEGDSLEAQQNAMHRLIEDRKQLDGWEVESVTPYIEAGRSGKDMNRPQMQRLQADVRDGKIDVVIAFKIDRVSRSVRDFLNLWHFFEEHNVELVILKEKFDTSHPAGEFLMVILLGFAQMERRVIGDRTQAVMEDRANRGLSNGGCRYGYKSDPKERGRLIPDPEWAKIIQENFFDAVERLGSAGAVQRELIERWQITVPKRDTRSGKVIGGKPFTKQQVMRILRNPLYIGQIIWGEIVCENCHEPLISKEQFERVQAILDQTTKHRSNRTAGRGRDYTLRGLVRCRCGAVMTPKSATGRNGKHRYYECTRKNHLGRTECAARGIPAEPLEAAVVARVAEIGTSEDARMQIITEALKLVDSNAHLAEKEAENVRNRRAVVKAEINRLVAVLKKSGDQVFESIREEMARLETEKRELDEKLRELQTRKTPLDEVTARAKTFIENWKGLGQLLSDITGDERRKLLEQFVEVIQLTPDRDDPKKGTYVMRLFPEAVRRVRNGAHREETLGTGDDPVLTESPLVREEGEKAPRVTQYANRGLGEVGAYTTNKLRQRRGYVLNPWNPIPARLEPKKRSAPPPRDRLQLARYYQSLLESGKIKSRAELARILGVSRARVTQVLNRLKQTNQLDRQGSIGTESCRSASATG